MASSSPMKAAGIVHVTAIQQAGYTSPVPGTRLSYEIRPDREGNPTAESLKIGYRPE